MKKIGLILLAISITFSFLGCAKHKSPAAIIIDPESTSNTLDYTPYPPATGNNFFTLDFYRQLKYSEEGNIFFSPFSIFSAMSMAGEGARNNTWDEMKKVLHLQEDNSIRWNAFLTLINTINNPDKKYSLKTVNKLWLDQTMSFLPEYVNTVQNYYLADLATLDFINNFDLSRITINNWVEQQTEGKIKELLPMGSVDSSARLVLTNAIYFKATWLNKFPKEGTYEQDFFVSPGNTIKVQMMHNKINGIIEDYFGKARVLELPYEGYEVSMFVFLPGEGGLTELEDYMTMDKINFWMESRKSTINQESYEISLALPKFKIETMYVLNNILSDMGMPLAFDPVRADFSGMIGKPGLFISSVVHKTFIEVYEDGTEAAASTGGIAGATSVPELFIVNKPFIFLICENSTGAILFMGRVIEPKIN